MIVLPFCCEKRREELVREQLDVVRALAQRRQVDLHHGETIVEILAQLAVGDRLLEVLVRRGDDADVDVDLLLAAEPANLPRLERAQQLHLDVRRHLGHLVEEDRAAARHLERARLLVGRAGEGALLVPEQLVLENLLGQRGAVEREERALGAIALVVQRARDELLAGAALAEDQHARGGRRDGLDHLIDRAHRLALAR